MPLLSAILAAIVGFAMPWRFGWEFAGRTTWVGAGDLALLGVAAGWLLVAPRRVLCEAHALMVRPTHALPIALLLGLSIGHAVATPAAGGGGPLPALATAWAIGAGLMLARFERTALLGGLRLGTWVSGLAGLALLAWRPELVIEHKYFAGLAGAKNAFAYFVAVSILAAVEPAMSGRRRWGIGTFLELALGIAFLALTNARGGALALGAAFLCLRGGGRTGALVRGLVALAACAFVSSAAVPRDRIQFSWAILAHADAIPIAGLGPGYGYGLDTALKLLLELGPAGFVALLALALGALRREGLTSWLALIAVFALAHDLARWPLFWMVLTGYRDNETTFESTRRTA